MSETTLLRPTGKIRFAGMWPVARILLTVGGFAFIVAGALLGALIALSRQALFSVPTWANELLTEFCAAAFFVVAVVAVVAALRWLMPPAAWPLFRGQVPAEVRKAGLHIARNWRMRDLRPVRGIGRGIAPRVVDDAGTRVYPGLEAVNAEEGGFSLAIRLPEPVPSAGRDEYLHRLPDELVNVVNLRRFGGDRPLVIPGPVVIENNRAHLRFYLRDETEQVREVAA